MALKRLIARVLTESRLSCCCTASFKPSVAAGVVAVAVVVAAAAAIVVAELGSVPLLPWQPRLFSLLSVRKAEERSSPNTPPVHRINSIDLLKVCHNYTRPTAPPKQGLTST